MDLVTGGTGIVGAHVLDALLAQGRAVRALLRHGGDVAMVRRILRHYHADGDARFQRIQWVEGDLFDVDRLREAVQGVEHVYHCAALVSFDPRDRDALLRTNVQGTANVVDAALDCGVRRLCHVSSTATIGGAMDGGTGEETKAFKEEKDSSAYAISKAQAELEVHRGIAEGLDAVMVNPCVVLGPGVPGRSSMTMIERVRKGTRFFPKGSNAVVDARDVATAMTSLITEGGTGERHLLIGENLPYRKLFTLIAASNGKNSTIRGSAVLDAGIGLAHGSGANLVRRQAVGDAQHGSHGLTDPALRRLQGREVVRSALPHGGRGRGECVCLPGQIRFNPGAAGSRSGDRCVR
jgi:dihydroflavonol-4-reductase